MVERIWVWNENCAGFSTSEEFHPWVDSVSQENDEDCGIQGFEQCFISKRMRLSPEFNMQEGDGDSSEESRPLGLKLRKTPSFLNLLEKKLSQWRKEDFSLGHNSPKTKFDDLGSQSSMEKLKAVNFPAILLQIGDWQWISANEGDLTAKLYYGKRKMVWEVLCGALKSKIEIQWSDITAIRAIIRDKEPGILEIELNQPPLFFGEIDPQPRKHTLWQPAFDFTGGQASIFRRHYMSFAPGLLDKHYEKLLQCDQQLFALSQKPFPSQEFPYFDSAVFGCSNISYNLNGYESEFRPGLQYSHRTFPSPFVPSDEKARNYRFPNQRQRVWGEGENVASDESQANYVLGSLDHLSAEDAGRFNPNTGVLNDFENHLLRDNQFVSSDKEMLYTNVKSMCSLLEPLDVNPYQSLDTHMVENTHENSMLDDLDSESMTWFSHEDPNESSKMELEMNNSLYQYVLPGSAIGDFLIPNAMQNTYNWA
ncbi:hypothetical protein Adt_17391 [Abeliophyllum distichum]|uniref:TRF2/HOY1 PH-like domain-containing protein n=1 Tax=Abeliophyllum distichum TaxID=126358 RepID=A0ABD1TGD3_9LAMI